MAAEAGLLPDRGGAAVARAEILIHKGGIVLRRAVHRPQPLRAQDVHGVIIDRADGRGQVVREEARLASGRLFPLPDKPEHEQHKQRRSGQDRQRQQNLEPVAEPKVHQRGILGIVALRLILGVIDRAVMRLLADQAGNVLIAFRLLHRGEVRRRHLKRQPAHAVLIVFHPCVCRRAGERKRLPGGKHLRVLLGDQKSLDIARGDAVIAEHQRRSRGIVDVIALLRAVEEVQDEVDPVADGREVRFLVVYVAREVKKNILLCILIVKMRLALLHRIIAQLFREIAVDVRGNRGVILIGKGIVGRLIAQELRVLRKLRKRSVDLLVLCDQPRPGRERIAALPVEALRRKRAVAHGGRIQPGAVRQQLIGGIEITRGEPDIFNGEAVLRFQKLRQHRIRRRSDLRLRIEAVLMQPVEAVRSGIERLGIQRGPAVVFIDLAREAAQIIGRRRLHGDVQNGLLRGAARADILQVTLRQTRGGVASVAKRLHLLPRPLHGAIQKRGLCALPAVQRQRKRKHQRGGAKPCAHAVASAKEQKVSEQLRQRGGEQPARRQARRKKQAQRGKQRRQAPEAARAAAARQARAPHAEQRAEHTQKQRRAAFLRDGEQLRIPGVQVLPCVKHAVCQRGDPAHSRPPENCRRDRAGAQPQSRRQPDTPAPEGHSNSRRCRGQHGKQAALLRQEGRRRQPDECRGKQRRGKAGAQAGKQIITVQGTRLPPDRAVRRAARSPRRRPLPAHPAAPAAA